MLHTGMATDGLYVAQAYMQYVLHSTNGNKGGPSRKDLIQLRPDSDGPQHQGPVRPGP